VSASRALESRNSSLPYLLLTKAAVGYHPFEQPRDKFPEPPLGRVPRPVRAVPVVPKSAVPLLFHCCFPGLCLASMDIPGYS
jgi:hypothetical protein